MTEHVIVTDADGIRTIRMNRPDKKNALTFAMYEAMTAALEGANADDSVGCGLIAEAASSLLAPRLMGQRRAFEFLVMGHPLDATHAKEFGIANIVVAPED